MLTRGGPATEGPGCKLMPRPPGPARYCGEASRGERPLMPTLSRDSLAEAGAQSNLDKYFQIVPFQWRHGKSLCS